MRTLALALVLLSAACDGGSLAGSASTSATSGAGGEGPVTGSGGGSGGQDAATTDAVTVGSTAASTGNGGAGDGGASSSVATSTTTATTGSGGGEPACPDASCPEFGVVCDPDACGSQWPSCDDMVCADLDPNALPGIGLGTTLIRTPPIDSVHPRCAENCTGATWAIRMRILGDAQCVRVVAPEGWGWAIGSGDVGPACGGGAACSQVETSSRFLEVAFTGEQAPGTLLSVTVSDDSPCFVDQPACDVGCNGEG